MKILYTAYCCHPHEGGESSNGWNYPLHSAMLGNIVWCITQTMNKDAIEKELTGNTLVGINFVYVVLPKWTNLLNVVGAGHYLVYVVWQYLAYRKAKELNRKIRFDLVHHISWGNLPLGTFLWKLNIPLIFGPVGGGQITPEGFKKYFGAKWNNELFRKIFLHLMLKLNPLIRNTLKNAKVVFTTNLETYHLAKNNGAKNVVLMLDTSISREYAPGHLPVRTASKEVKLLWVGRLFAHKGVLLVLEALRHVKNREKIKLSIVGYGPLSDKIEQFIRDHDLYHVAMLKGRLDWEELKKEYYQSDVFIFCSLRDSFGAQLMEAMSFALPVITLDLSGARDFIPEEASIKIKSGDPEEAIKEIAHAIDTLAINEERRIKMGISGYNFAQENYWENKIKAVSRYY
jgi:glycosyltransferase involved in cell wall biosynthesis